MVALDVPIFIEILDLVPLDTVGRFFVGLIEKYCISAEPVLDDKTLPVYV
jgi:hypothetical protein